MSEKLQEILFACLRRPESEWAEAVEQACADHPGSADSLRSRFASLVAMGMAEDPEAPRRIGRYELLQPLGGGAMGTVFLARRTAAVGGVASELTSAVGGANDGHGADEGGDELKRGTAGEPGAERFAIKVMQPGLRFSAAAQARFARERAIVSKLRHPGFCEVRDAGIADGVPFLAMEFIDGEDLSQWIRRRAQGRGLPDEAEQREIVGLMAQVARALQAAHDAGLLHRDVKPGNIMVRRSDRQPVLLDFGLARELEEAGTRLTGSGTWVGSPAYLAPECLAGHRSHDARADVYAAGVSLFECVTLQLPFQGPTREALFHAILRGRVPDPREMHSGVLPSLAHVLRVAMAKAPRQRYSSAAALASDLEALAAGGRVLVRAPSLLERGVRLVRRRPVVAAFVGLLMVALAVTALVLRQISESFDRVRALGLASAAANATPESAVVLSRRAVRLLQHPATVSELHAAVARFHRRTVYPPAPARIERVGFLPEGAGAWAQTPAGDVQVLGRDGQVVARWAGIRQVVPVDADRIAFFDAEGLGCWHRGIGVTRLEASRVRAIGVRGRDLWAVSETATGLVLRIHRWPRAAPVPAPGTTAPLFEGACDEVALVGGHVFVSARGQTTRVRPTGVVEGRFPGARVLAAAADGSAFVIADETRAIWYRSDSRETRPREVRRFPVEVRRFAFASRGGRLVVLQDRAALRVFDADGTLLGAVPPQGVVVESVGLSPRGSVLAMGGGDGVVRLFAADGARIGALHGHDGHVTCLAFRCDGEELVTGSYDRQVRLFAVRPSRDHLFGTGTAPVVGVDMGLGKQMVWWDREGRLWQHGGARAGVPRATSTRIATQRMATHRPWPDPVSQARFCGPQRDQILVIHRDGRVGVWSMADGAKGWPSEETSETDVDAVPNRRGPVARLPPWKGTVIDLTVSPGGLRAVAAGAAGSLRTWALRDGLWKQIGSFASGFGEDLRCAAVGDDGAVAAGNAQGWVQTWHADGALHRRFRAHEDWIWSVRVAADGTILTTSRDNTARLWEAGGAVGAASAPLVTFRGHAGTLARGVFSPSGEVVATASTDRTLRLWNRDGTLRAVLRGHEGQVWDVAFDPAGETLVSGGFDRQVRRWPVLIEDLQALADELVTRPASATERELFAR